LDPIKVRYLTPNGMRSLGKPKMRWKFNVKQKTEWMQQATKLNAEEIKKNTVIVHIFSFKCEIALFAL
jgi:hypothetical protein